MGMTLDSIVRSQVVSRLKRSACGAAARSSTSCVFPEKSLCAFLLLFSFCFMFLMKIASSNAGNIYKIGFPEIE